MLHTNNKAGRLWEQKSCQAPGDSLAGQEGSTVHQEKQFDRARGLLEETWQSKQQGTC